MEGRREAECGGKHLAKPPRRWHGRLVFLPERRTLSPPPAAGAIFRTELGVQLARDVGFS